MKTRLALSLAWGASSAGAFYGLLRVGQWLLFPEADPALVVWSEHAGYFWRALTASYLGGMVAFVAWAFAGAAPERVARALVPAVTVCAAILALQGLLVP